MKAPAISMATGTIILEAHDACISDCERLEMLIAERFGSRIMVGLIGGLVLLTNEALHIVE